LQAEEEIDSLPAPFITVKQRVSLNNSAGWMKCHRVIGWRGVWTCAHAPGAPLPCMDDELVYKRKDVKKSQRKETLNNGAGAPLSMRYSRSHQQS